MQISRPGAKSDCRSTWTFCGDFLTNSAAEIQFRQARYGVRSRIYIVRWRLHSEIDTLEALWQVMSVRFAMHH